MFTDLSSASGYRGLNVTYSPKRGAALLPEADLFRARCRAKPNLAI